MNYKNKNINIMNNKKEISYIDNKLNNINKSNANCITKCKKTGLKIKEYGNEYKSDPFNGIDPLKLREDEEELKEYKANKVFNNFPFLEQREQREQREQKHISIQKGQSQVEGVNNNKKYEINLDLNLENYSREELFKLFGLKKDILLNEEILKEAKKILYKVHPDKSKLDEKYFIFFSQAYKKIIEIYEFQNNFKKDKKVISPPVKTDEYYSEDKINTLNNMFENKSNLKNPENFNKWFNAQFEKYNSDNMNNDIGYGNWLKSDEDIIYTPQNMNKDIMKKEIDKLKKNIQALTPYKGLENNYSNISNNCSTLMEYNNGYNSSMLFNNGSVGYSDLKQAYVESVIPISEEDYDKIPKYKNIQELKLQRDNTNITPLSKEEASKLLYYENKKNNEESSALAFYYAKQAEKNKKKDKLFWTSLKQITM